MFRISLLLLAIIFSAFPVHAEEKVSIQVIVDNSAALQNQKEAANAKKRLFFLLSELRKKRGFRNAAVTVISTNNPRTLWKGRPKDVFRNGAELLSKIEPVENGCSDLVGAFGQARDNLAIERPDKKVVIVIGSMIHTGVPCEKKTITLPQDAPRNLDLGFMNDTKLILHWCHALQKSPWVRLLRHQRIEDVELHDEASTLAVLKKGLSEGGI